MLNFFKIFCLIGTFFLNFNNTSNGITFMETVNKAYDKYFLVEDKEIVVGDFTLVFGQVDDKYYLSCYLFNTGAQNNHYIKVIVNEQSLTTFVSDGGVVEGYGLELKSKDTFKIYVSDKEHDLLIGTYQVGDLIDDLLVNHQVGFGTKEFPKNKREIDFIRTIKLYIYLFIFLSLAFVGVLIFLYKFRMGRFNERYKKLEPNIFKQEVEEEEVIDASFTVEQENKQEIMDRLFEEFRHGDITEDELNEKLKKLWWKE